MTSIIANENLEESLMSRYTRPVLSLVGILSLTSACGASQNSSLDASVNQNIEQKWSSQIDLSKELNPDLADNLKASKSSLDSIEVGAKLSASFKFGQSVIFDVGGGMEWSDVFERKVLHEVVVGREKDRDGSGDGQGVFIDAQTVAANRYINCRSQKVLTDNSSFGGNASGGISFMGLELGARAGAGQKISASTDYTMNRGFYKTKQNTPLARIFELCGDIAKSDVALQNIDHINEVVRLNFNAGEDLEKLAREVANGKKVNNFKFHNIKYDFKIIRRENGRMTFEIFPDTHHADPKLEAVVSYHQDQNRTIVDKVEQRCVSNCQNYHDAESKHGLKSHGDRATKAQSEKYIKLISTIFTATATNSR